MHDLYLFPSCIDNNWERRLRSPADVVGLIFICRAAALCIHPHRYRKKTDFFKTPHRNFKENLVTIDLLFFFFWKHFCCRWNNLLFVFTISPLCTRKIDFLKEKTDPTVQKSRSSSYPSNFRMNFDYVILFRIETRKKLNYVPLFPICYKTYVTFIYF